MNRTIKRRLIESIGGGIVAIVLFFFLTGVKVPNLDDRTDTYFSQAIYKAGLAYATCRVINASVSVIKESSLQLEPAGLGVSLAVGQVLDPIDDMTERLSDVLVTAITALGVQKLTFEIAQALAPSVFAVLLFGYAVLVWFENPRITAFRKGLIRLLLFIAIARFCLPVSSLVNDFLQENYFAQQIAEANDQLAMSSAELDRLKEVSLPEIDGLLGTLENSAAFIKQKTVEFKNVLISTTQNMGLMIENMLKLTFLYMGIFIIQVIVLPILSFWLLVKFANLFFVKQISYKKPVVPMPARGA